jgi:hypothetical protein
VTKLDYERRLPPDPAGRRRGRKRRAWLLALAFMPLLLVLIVATGTRMGCVMLLCWLAVSATFARLYAMHGEGERQDL